MMDAQCMPGGTSLVAPCQGQEAALFIGTGNREGVGLQSW